jgi:hypothetical protein
MRYRGWPPLPSSTMMLVGGFLPKARLTPGPQMHHEGGESMLRDIGESLPWQRALRPARFGSGRAR